MPQRAKGETHAADVIGGVVMVAGNLGRGLFRVWMVVSLLWMGWNIWYFFDLDCLFGLSARCYSRIILNPNYVDPVNHYLVFALKAFGLPLSALVVGAAAFWTLSGFQRDRTSS